MWFSVAQVGWSWPQKVDLSFLGPLGATEGLRINASGFQRTCGSSGARSMFSPNW